MVEGVEGVGEAVTAGIAGRTFEPRAGEGAGHGKQCLNCGTALSGEFCHVCGQRARVHRTLGAWWHDLAHGVLHLDGKIWRTLPLLAWRPGELTRRYIKGERARFISPLALFLFSVFLMFALFSALGASALGVDPDGLQQGVSEEVVKAERHLANVERERQAAAAAGKPTAPFDARLKSAREELSLLREMAERGMVQGSAIRVSDDLPPALRKPINKAAQNPSLFFYKVQANAYKFSWALIPISVPFLWLLFIHRRRYREQFKAYDHLVFITYSIAFMSLGVIAFSVLHWIGIGSTLLSLALFLIPPVHMYRQLRGAYELSRWSALWRTFFLLIFASVAASLFLLLLLALGLLG
ncbi:MAG TPA: DUF3667 domain-containing protein [Allosphingosinicella sp.]|nr:DUF3667 domain-containing protein [Allosphingosinicella sp.]